jgi:hypothetical protein
VRLVYFHLVVDYLNQLPDPLKIATAESLSYLQTFGRASQLPDVRSIASVPNLYETRTQMNVSGKRHTIRVLVMMHTDEVLVACVAGDKDAWSRQWPNQDWYDAWIPVALAVYDSMKEQLT